MRRLLKLRMGRRQAGFAMIDALVGLALIGSASVTYLGSLAVTSKAKMVADDQATAGSLGQTQLEFVKKSAYQSGATTYAAAPMPGEVDYTGYSVAVTAAAVNSPDDGIQKITVTVSRNGRVIDTFEGYKVNR